MAALLVGHQAGARTVSLPLLCACGILVTVPNAWARTRTGATTCIRLGDPSLRSRRAQQDVCPPSATIPPASGFRRSPIVRRLRISERAGCDLCSPVTGPARREFTMNDVGPKWRPVATQPSPACGERASAAAIGTSRIHPCRRRAPTCLQVKPTRGLQAVGCCVMGRRWPPQFLAPIACAG